MSGNPGQAVPTLEELRIRRAILRLGTPGQRRRRRRRVPRPLHPRGAALGYARALNAMVRELRAIVREQVLPELPSLAAQGRSDSQKQELAQFGKSSRFDQVDTQVERIIGRVRVLFGERVHPRPMALDAAAAVDAFSEQDLIRVLGIDPGLIPNVGELLEAFVADNVRLIRSIPDRLLDDVEGIVLRGIRRGQSATEMAREIQARTGVAQRRARLIARDQVASLNGELTQRRQTALGIREYIWRTSRDSKVRDAHKDREGKTFRWDRPPGGEFPGSAVNCRCTAEPVLSDDIL